MKRSLGSGFIREVVLGIGAALATALLRPWAVAAKRRCGNAAAAALALGVAAGGCARPPAGLDGAVAWLLAQQGTDGSIPARDYGVLRAGHSTTACAAYALACLPHRSPAVDAACAHALAFLRRHGVVPSRDVDYPCYTAAFWILAAVRLQSPAGAQQDIAGAVAFLRRHQLAEQRGWQAADPEFGGFGFGVAAGDKPAEGDVASLSVTSFVVQALCAAGVASDDPMLRAARTFLERCQVLADDDPLRHGGFVHHPRPGPAQSKAGAHAGVVLPYASATCDGWRALHALGLAASPRAQAAAAWLRRHADPPAVAGFASSDAAHVPYEPALRIYALATLAEALPSLPAVNPAWRPAIVAALLARQRPDGALVGWSPLLKEDDPVVATTLGVIALASAAPR